MRKIFSFIIVTLVLLVFSSCGGLRNKSSIHLKDSISGADFSIKIRVKRSGSTSPSAYFSINKNTEELATEITKIDPSLSAIVYQEKFILISTASSFYLLHQIEKLEEDKENENRYSFFAPIGRFEINTRMDTDIDMYIPYHLIKGLTVQYNPGYKSSYPKTLECDAYGTIDDFFEFYNKFEQCDVVKETDSIIVTSKKNGYKMSLTFSQHENLSKVTFLIL